MKRILILLAFILSFTIVVDAQMRTSNLRSGVTYVEVTTDYTLTNTVPQYWQINAGQNYYTAQTCVIHLDSLAGNHTNVAVQLQGRVSTTASTWVNIGSAVNWTGTTSDTTIIYTNATENLYREFKLLFTGTGTGTTTISNMEFKQYFGTP
jgi:hypothetical protein